MGEQKLETFTKMCSFTTGKIWMVVKAMSSVEWHEERFHSRDLTGRIQRKIAACQSHISLHILMIGVLPYDHRSPSFDHRRVSYGAWSATYALWLWPNFTLAFKTRSSITSRIFPFAPPQGLAFKNATASSFSQDNSQVCTAVVALSRAPMIYA